MKVFLKEIKNKRMFYELTCIRSQRVLALDQMHFPTAFNPHDM